MLGFFLRKLHHRQGSLAARLLEDQPCRQEEDLKYADIFASKVWSCSYHLPSLRFILERIYESEKRKAEKNHFGDEKV